MIKMIQILLLISLAVSCDKFKDKLIFPLQKFDFKKDSWVLINVNHSNEPRISYVNGSEKINKSKSIIYIVDLKIYHGSTPDCELMLYKNKKLIYSLYYNSSDDINFQGLEKYFNPIELDYYKLKDELPDELFE